MEFCFSTFVVQLRAVNRVTLPSNSGSTLHGAVGHAFRRVECSRQRHDCQDCFLQDECIYYRYFLRTHHGKKQPVRPYIIEAPHGNPMVVEPGELISFMFILVGESLKHLLKFFAVFEAMGECGLGKGWRKGDGRCYLETVYCVGDEGYISLYPQKDRRAAMPAPLKRRWSEFCQPIDRPLEKIRVRFLTPTRIQLDGKLIDRVPFYALVARLLDRILDLDREYCGGGLSFPVEDLVKLAQSEVEIAEDRTAWYDWERYSSRQNSRMKFGGITGEIVYRGNLTPFIPYLLLGEYIHVGKQATFGNGTIKVDFL
jgi:hypothetical protein|tara:strand:+ start:3753 stop:4691 length:939 start_codon:yes stop_codon:yes gene_type:complete